jgi:hypothetical protein
MRWQGIALAVLAIVAYLAYRPLRPAAPPTSGMEVGAEGELTLRVVPQREGNRRRLRLSSPSGSATLVLEDAKGKGPFLFGDGRFEPLGREDGAGFVADVARWLGVDPPPDPPRPGSLEPFKIAYALLGDRDGWEATKLFLEFGHRYAEVFLNLHPSGTEAVLLEKDEEYREDLVALLAMALRDGTPQRRTVARDPDLATDEPLVAQLRPLRCEGELKRAMWTARGFLGVVGSRPARFVLWADGSAEPSDAGTADGVVTFLASSPKGDRVAAMLVHPGQPDAYSSDDPTDLLVLDLPGGVRTIARSEPELLLMSHSAVAFSPDGTMLAASAPVDSKPPRRSRVRVFHAATGGRLFETDPSLDLDVEAWDPDGLVLCRAEFDDRLGYKRTWYRWAPGSGDPAEIAPVPLRSPDRRYSIGATADGDLEVRGPDGVRTFASGDDEERTFFLGLEEFPPQWCGPHGLLVTLGADLLVLDLETMKLRHVFPARGWSLVAADPAGIRILATDAEGLPHAGEAR